MSLKTRVAEIFVRRCARWCGILMRMLVFKRRWRSFEMVVIVRIGCHWWCGKGESGFYERCVEL